ncbi:helicase superfamily protein [Escherichia coli]|nr:helicase superfamily protein [Escherichia coli]
MSQCWSNFWPAGNAAERTIPFRQLPFRKSDLPLNFFPNLTLPFPPHAHQARAFQRLGSDAPQPTLVATGTGSGKTECFMFPLLNHCAGASQAGVKAIIIYPMNALATDQASRFAKTIASDPQLHGKVTVGLFVGDSEIEPSKKMSAEKVITCKHTLRESPPDILLTNYKMLDYLLMRPGDQPLWRYNQPGSLRYLVVDELHTFDGAQGSDLACLVRRLKHHIGVDNQRFACVGHQLPSATNWGNCSITQKQSLTSRLPMTPLFAKIATRQRSTCRITPLRTVSIRGRRSLRPWTRRVTLPR